LSTFVFYALIGIILIFLYYKISQNLKTANRFLTSSGTRKRQETSSKHDSNSSYILRDIKGSNSELNSEQQKTSISSKKNSRSISLIKKADSKIKKSSIDNKTVVNRKKLITMIMWVIICFYVCLTPIKAWNLGKFCYRF
jgi:hypothetical protein